ncbi:uncharacterized protein MELLADRAFT_94358 [Melampsora larici-populina 98AG31]|uniref:Secreted protein n=1 Tax=Melampsora larici-populina (strain 98AG31 / pathotype 3-4-7) TaxID=747676 RepID=F4RB80_MELLP|nr:uncharacterized protein MELLADRAFT_94358 [Melampsora larici-populina 98AG31]EGG10402.1 hypothetical protein MELLADRAFT_94358 [Melampsora larici-populina 98AG31]
MINFSTTILLAVALYLCILVPDGLLSPLNSIVYQPQGFSMNDVCADTVACVVLDSDWPSTKTFTCQDRQVTPASIQSSRFSMMGGSGFNVSDADWPVSASRGCANSNGLKRSYFNGEWTVYYSIQAKCDCTGAGRIPDCGTFNGGSATACNVATFKFCSLEMGEIPCQAV